MSALFPTRSFLELLPNFGDSAPTLMLDASGQEHVMVHDFESEPPRLLDYTIGGAAEPSVILTRETDTGDVRALRCGPPPMGALC